MSNDEFKVKERRRFPRVKVEGRAIVLGADDFCGRYAIENLSVGGARFRDSSPLQAGAEIIAVLELDCEEAPIRVNGTVIRCHQVSEQTCDLYVAFGDLKEKTHDLLQRIVRAELNRRKQNPTVLVLDESRSVQSELKGEIISLGHNAISVGTKKEAAWLLQDAGVCIDAIFLNPLQNGDEDYRFVEFLASEFPKLQVILFVEGAPGGRSEIDRFNRFAYSILFEPWTKEAIEKTVGL